MMRKLLFVITICAVLFSGCSKTDNSNSRPNTVGLTSNGLSLVMTSTEPPSTDNVVNVVLVKTSSSTALILSAYNTTTTRQFDLHLKAYGDNTGAGTFRQSDNNGDNTFNEYYSNGQSWVIDHSDLLVTNNNDTYVSGNFALYLKNAGGSKVVNGYFIGNRVVVQ